MALADRIGTWIAEQVGAAGLNGVVVALSGGIDSAVVAGLCARGLGAAQVLGLILPCHSSPRDAEDAELVAATWGIEHQTIDLSGLFDTFETLLPAGNDLAVANLKPRLRMI